MLYALLGMVAAWCGLAIFNAYGTRPAVIGLTDSRLADCPPSPNCVCSQASRDEQRIEPIAYTGSREEALAAIKALIDETAGMRLVLEEEGYIHATATSMILRFVDDVEFLVDEQAGVIHLRSASRVGYSDLGANAKRVAALKASLESRL